MNNCDAQYCTAVTTKYKAQIANIVVRKMGNMVVFNRLHLRFGPLGRFWDIRILGKTVKKRYFLTFLMPAKNGQKTLKKRSAASQNIEQLLKTFQKHSKNIPRTLFWNVLAPKNHQKGARARARARPPFGWVFKAKTLKLVSRERLLKVFGTFF